MMAVRKLLAKGVGGDVTGDDLANTTDVRFTETKFLCCFASNNDCIVPWWGVLPAYYEWLF